MAHRIKVKLGDAEFEAEGAEERVQAQYDQFLATYERGAEKSRASPDKVPTPAPTPTLDEDQLGSLFEERQDGLVTLLGQPTGDDSDVNGLLVLLYGYRKLKAQENVLATQLMKAATQSGLPVTRIDRLMAVHSQFVIRAGSRKGTSYRLNNRGIIKAQELAKQILS